jgi:hypothetical protein
MIKPTGIIKKMDNESLADVNGKIYCLPNKHSAPVTKLFKNKGFQIN